MCDKVVENIEVKIDDQLLILPTFEPMIVKNELVLDKKVNHAKVEVDPFEEKNFLFYLLH